jgi:hypothetical protein
MLCQLKKCCHRIGNDTCSKDVSCSRFSCFFCLLGFEEELEVVEVVVEVVVDEVEGVLLVETPTSGEFELTIM